jgi:hypothetical protein
MPEYGPYLRGFGIKKGLKLAGYELISYSISHEEIKKYEKYTYDVILNFEAKNNTYEPKQLLHDLRKQTEKSRIIYTRFGNPYRCWFGKPTIIEQNKNLNKIKILCLGHAKRIYIMKINKN